jgi:hypothetical protein
MTTNPLPRLSIVTPSFNQGEFLEECIDSILGQNYPNLEYVIMDGGSTDNSVEIIKKYEKYLTYWQSGPDGGQYAAVNEGFRKTSGEVMAWLNSDDKYHDRSLFTAACVFATHPEISWIMGRPTFWDRDGGIIRIEETLATHCRADFLQKKYNDPFVQQESTFWRRDLWEQAGGYVRGDLNYAGDLELWVRFFRHAELYSVDALLGGYRSHGNQKALQAMDRYVAEAESVLSEEIERVKTEDSPRLRPALEPVTISAVDMRGYLKESCAPVPFPPGGGHQAYKYLMQRLEASSTQLAELQKRLELLESELVELDGCCRNKQARLDAIDASLSWRVMARIFHLIGRVRGRKQDIR